jgi:hypothetical protein
MFIPDPDLDFLHIPGSGVKKGTGSRIRVRNTAFWVDFQEKNPSHRRTILVQNYSY